MKTGKILLSGLISSLSIILFSCYVFENPLDPEAANYQGFQTVATVNEVVPPDEEIILDASSDEMEIAVAYCPDATTYEIKIYRTPAYTSPYYEAYSETNIFDLASADLYNGLWYCVVRAYSSSDGYWGAWSTYGSFEVIGSSSDDDSEETEAEISISQGTTDIPLNGTYDFGSVLSGSSRTVTFTIENSGTAALNLTGNPVVAISGTNASEFNVTAQPATSSVASGGTTTFTVTFSPQSEGSKTATVTIANNDSDEGTYSFALNGARSDDPEPEINVKKENTNIPSGESYDFGGVETGSSASADFTIENIGTATLNLTGNPVVTINGTNASEFSVTAQPSSPVASGGTVTFTITFSPQSEGSKIATVTIANNDSDEDTYSVTLTGNGTSGGGDTTGRWDSTAWDACVWAE